MLIPGAAGPVHGETRRGRGEVLPEYADRRPLGGAVASGAPGGGASQDPVNRAWPLATHLTFRAPERVLPHSRELHEEGNAGQRAPA